MLGLMAIDFAGKATNGIAIRSVDNELIYWENVNYEAESPYHFRKLMMKKIKDLSEKYIFDTIILERVRMMRGGMVSSMGSIESLTRYQTSLIDNFSEKFDIFAVDVRSWKKDILGSAKATKEDSIKYVQEHYPEVNLERVIHHVRKEDEIVLSHDLADAICISELINYPRHFVDKNKLNYK